MPQVNGESNFKDAESEHDQRVIDERARLWESLARAQKEIDGALSAYYKLTSGPAWDVEYENTPRLKDHLAETSRLLTITRALMPTAGDASTNTDRQLADTVRALMSGSHLK